ncbi:hypothetical protein [Streptomyces sp. NRRL S-350]|uniref:baeRF2 domain-containing protein n=1 Tax=Streptomyces sp. NRRL S-350 TaxID=1463902 RepID=UPI0004BF816E|nr:hypothetical protein [Streptomyces sp. NRRL S-350]
MDLAFLTPLLDRPGPWATVYLDTSHTTEDAVRRRALIDRAAVHRLAEAGADEATCGAVRDHLAAEPASGSPPGRALFAADGEVALDVPLAVSPPDVTATWAPLPHTGPLVGLVDDNAPTCLVAAIDRTGATLERHELGRRARIDTVDTPQWQGRGHRAPPADRYEWHYRHRVEDTWDRTAAVIADHLARAWPQSDARLLVLTGDARERRAVHDRLPRPLQALTVELDGGARGAGATGEAFDRRLAEAWDDHRGRHLAEVLDAYHAAVGRPGGQGTDAAGIRTAAGPAAQGIPAVVSAAQQHQLAALLLQPSGHDPERPVWTGPEPDHIGVHRADLRGMGVAHPAQAPAADALLRTAAASGAEALVVPDALPGPPGGLGALLRWAA